MNKTLLIKLAVSLFAASLLCACVKSGETVSSKTLIPNSTDHLPSKQPAVNETIRFLEARIKHNSEDFIAYNKLASEYLQQMRETGDANYLTLASRTANASLEILPPHQNKEGLALLALVEYASHDFTQARNYAEELVKLEPDKGYAYQILGDALLELGKYKEAENAFRKMQSFGGIQLITQSAMRQRLARLAALKGNPKGAKNHYTEALKLVRAMPVPPPETVAYCQWQLGETAFNAGDYETAEKYYKDALETYPEYTNALASSGKVRAALGDFPGAVEFYERAVKRLPDIYFVAALGDLYKAAGRDADAQMQYELVEQIGYLGAENGALYNRWLAVFYADHNLKPEEAYQLAAKEYETRRDIYGADTLAWTALKAGKIAEAREKINEALQLGTLDARLFYHAGMISHAAGDTAAARKYLQRALTLNPKFDVLQAETCRKTLESL